MPHRPLSTLSHVELLTPRPDESVAFARDILGMTVVGEQGHSTFLRCWGDYYGYSLVLTAEDFDYDMAIGGKRFFGIIGEQALGKRQRTGALEVADENPAEGEGHSGALRAAGGFFR